MKTAVLRLIIFNSGVPREGTKKKKKKMENYPDAVDEAELPQVPRKRLKMNKKKTPESRVEDLTPRPQSVMDGRTRPDLPPGEPSASCQEAFGRTLRPRPLPPINFGMARDPRMMFRAPIAAAEQARGMLFREIVDYLRDMHGFSCISNGPSRAIMAKTDPSTGIISNELLTVSLTPGATMSVPVPPLPLLPCLYPPM